MSPEKLSHVVERLSESQGVSTALEGKGAALNKVMKMNKIQLGIGEKVYQIKRKSLKNSWLYGEYEKLSQIITFSFDFPLFCIGMKIFPCYVVELQFYCK